MRDNASSTIPLGWEVQFCTGVTSARWNIVTNSARLTGVRWAKETGTIVATKDAARYSRPDFVMKPCVYRNIGKHHVQCCDAFYGCNADETQDKRCRLGTCECVCRTYKAGSHVSVALFVSPHPPLHCRIVDIRGIPDVLLDIVKKCVWCLRIHAMCQREYFRGLRAQDLTAGFEAGRSMSSALFRMKYKTASLYHASSGTSP